MRHDVLAPASQDQPQDSTLNDILSLARAEESLWPELEAQARSQGLICMAEDDEEPVTGEVENPTPDDEHPQNGDQPGAEEEEVPDFLGAYDLGDVPPEARPVAEATVKRLTAAYTKQRQEDTQAVRNAQAWQEVVEGLQDPELAPGIAQRLGLQLGDVEDDEIDLGFEDHDPHERIDLLEGQLAERDQLDQARQLVAQENNSVADQLEELEKTLDMDFSEEEVANLYMLADEHRNAQGEPDLKAALKVHEGTVAAAQQRIAKAKLKAPLRMARGRAGTRQVDLKKETPEERKERMAAAVDAVAASRG